MTTSTAPVADAPATAVEVDPIYGVPLDKVGDADFLAKQIYAQLLGFIADGDPLELSTKSVHAAGVFVNATSGNCV